MRARISMVQKNYASAVDELTCVLYQDREMVSETLLTLQEFYQKLNQSTQWANFLKRCAKEEETGSTTELLC